MSVSLLEDTRAGHQDFDRLTSHLTSTLLPGTPKVHRDRLTQGHQASHLVTLLTRRASALVESYDDRSGERAKEIEKLSGAGGAGGAGEDMAEFYVRLGKLKEFHRKYPGQAAEDPEPDRSLLDGDATDERDFVDKMFRGEEVLGRYLDLHAQHDTFNNLSPSTIKRLAYIPYVDSFDKFDLIPRAVKNRPEYESYLHSLRDYLVSFHRRTQPLHDLDHDLAEAKATFVSQWEAKQCPGWDNPANGAEGASGDVKQEGIFCHACSRSYAKQTVYDAHLTSKKHIKAAQRLASDPSASTSAPTADGPSGEDALPTADMRRAKDRPLALMECHIAVLGKLLGTTRADTKANVERRSALTDKERQQETEEAEAREAKEREEAEKAGDAAAKRELAEEEEEDEARIYNPLKLPLGWDGKPIPYWLYKLHGLGVEYKCEICSDYVYMGRKNFERHFQESRHAFGMRALGLPNTKHFHEITRIEDAFALAEKLKSEGRAEIFRDETMEELEDDDGNVYNRKTFEDLKRQGLL